MKDIKLSFPYPSTSRHNLSQDIALSMSMGLVIPVRTVEVLPGDSHRIGTSFSLISNPLIKPLLQGVNMRYCRFWVPRRIYHIDQRANNSNYDPNTAPVRHGIFGDLRVPILSRDNQTLHYSNFQQSSLFDYLDLAGVESNYVVSANVIPSTLYNVSTSDYVYHFNVESYIGYVDICRNYFGDSATNMIAWMAERADKNPQRVVCVSPLDGLDNYIDEVQNSVGYVRPYNFASSGVSTTAKPVEFQAFVLPSGSAFYELSANMYNGNNTFSAGYFGLSHVGLCVPLNRPDRLSRLFDTRPLTSQNATVAAGEVSIGNLAFLSKLQRYLTRKFFGGSRYTDIMYSIFGQRVPHVDSPVLLDVFDYEVGSELVSSTNATTNQNPGVLGGYLRASGNLVTKGGRYKKRYTFNEAGYLMDLVYIMPRLFRSAFVPDFYALAGRASDLVDVPMAQGNFVPDFNGIGWQQPAFVGYFRRVLYPASGDDATTTQVGGLCSEPSWQQYRTIPDVCKGAFNPLRCPASTPTNFGELSRTNNFNSPLFVFNDRMNPFNVSYGFTINDKINEPVQLRIMRARMYYSDPNQLNSVFGTDTLTFDNIFAVFRYSHQAKRQVSKRFVLSFN